MTQPKNVDILIVNQYVLVYTNMDYQANNSIITKYQPVVGFLIYFMMETRFDITYTVFTVTQFTSNLISELVAAVK